MSGLKAPSETVQLHLKHISSVSSKNSNPSNNNKSCKKKTLSHQTYQTKAYVDPAAVRQVVCAETLWWMVPSEAWNICLVDSYWIHLEMLISQINYLFNNCASFQLFCLGCFIVCFHCVMFSRMLSASQRCQSLYRSACLFCLLTPHSSFRWTVTSLPLSINPFGAICPKVSDAKSMTASLNPHFPPNGICGHINRTLLGYAHSRSVSSIRPHGSCRAPDWFLAFQWIDWEKET